MKIKELLSSSRSGDYQNSNYLKFVNEINFSFNVPSIHIAGTNGKGSNANYLCNIYQSSGLKVGLYTSPYLFEHNEMIQINGVNISDSEFEKYYELFSKSFKKYNLSEFEIMTIIAFKYFEDNRCDLCIIECGMGGEFDATNIFTPILSVITSISLEHTMFLGRTISEVAYHKAGIIKRNVPVVIGSLNEEAMNVINSTAKQLNSKVISAVEPSNVVVCDDGIRFSYMTYKDLFIQSKALYSVYDARIALEVINALQNFKLITENDVKNGLMKTSMICRMDIIKTNPFFIIDGGHNPEGISTLKNSILKLNISTPIHVVFASFKDKNIQAMLSEIGSFSDEIILTTFNHPRARTQEDYFLFGEDYKFVENTIDAVNQIKEAYPNDAILITGSLAFAAYVKNLINKGELK